MHSIQEQSKFYILSTSYPEALRRTREDVREQLEEAISEQLDDIWNASFTLKYMIDSHDHYVKILEDLNQDEKGLAVLNELYSALSHIDYSKDMYAFIKTAQETMQSPAFISKLSELSDAYKTKGRNLVKGGVIFVVAALILISVPSAWIVLGIILAALIGGYLLATSRDAYKKQSAIDKHIDVLSQVVAQDTYGGYSETYKYYDKDHQLIIANCHHEALPIESLQKRFLGSPWDTLRLSENKNESLCDIVQERLNRLPKRF